MKEIIVLDGKVYVREKANNIIVKDGCLYACDYEPDSNPENWLTINGAHVHIDNEGNIDGGAGGKFNGSTYKGTQKAKHTAQKTSTAKTAGNKDVRVKLKNGVTLRWQEVPGEPDKVYNPETREMYTFKGGLKAAIEKAKSQGAEIEDYEKSPSDPYQAESKNRQDRRLARSATATRRASKRSRPPGAR